MSSTSSTEGGALAEGAKDRARKSQIYNKTLVAALLLSLLAPFIWNIIHYAGWGHGFLAESSIYSLDRHKYFSDLLLHKSVFFSGQYSIFVLNYFIWYALWSTLSKLGLSDITSYFVLVAAFYTLGFLSFVKLLLFLTDKSLKSIDIAELNVIGLMALLYFSSLSMFNYIKSNIFFVLPYLILPAMLYISSRYLRTNDKRYLLMFLCTGVLIADLNVTHAIILTCFLNAFLIMLARHYQLTVRQLCTRVAAVNALLLPAYCFLAILVLSDVSYSGGLHAFVRVATENMYSNSTTYINVLSQLTDWGLFGSWHGARYYDFAAFYANNRTRVLALPIYILLAVALASGSSERRQRRLAIGLLAIFAVVFQLMLGNNNALYNYLYAHVVEFQVFRNVTKLAPLLYLLLLLATFLLIRDRLSSRWRYLAVTSLLVASLGYNIPYWSYAGYFFRARTIERIPPYWRQAADFINTQAEPSGKILALPAIYINDVFDWDGKQDWVQGSLLDILLDRNRSYRLSECCIGTPEFQADAKATFTRSARSIRQLDTDYAKLSILVHKYNLDFVVLSTDLLSEYERIGDIERWLTRDGYHLAAQYGAVSIYRNRSLLGSEVTGSGVSVAKIDNLTYRLRIARLWRQRRFTINDPYNRGWLLMPEPWSARDVEPSALERVVTAFRREDRGFDHRADGSGFNQWVLSQAYIERNYPTRYYQRNRDGSISVRLRLYFLPEERAIGLAFCGIGSFALLLLIVTWSLVRQCRRRFDAGNI